jgi:anti-sigma B factor antagonist
MSETTMHAVRPVFHLDSTTCGTTRTVTVAGELDLAVCDRVQAAVDAAVAACPDTVVVDLSPLAFIDSSGIHALVAAHRHALARDVRLVAIPAPPAVHHVFELCGLDAALPFVAGGSA